MDDIFKQSGAGGRAGTVAKILSPKTLGRFTKSAAQPERLSRILNAERFTTNTGQIAILAPVGRNEGRHALAGVSARACVFQDQATGAGLGMKCLDLTGERALAFPGWLDAGGTGFGLLVDGLTKAETWA